MMCWLISLIAYVMRKGRKASSAKDGLELDAIASYAWALLSQPTPLQTLFDTLQWDKNEHDTSLFSTFYLNFFLKI